MKTIGLVGGVASGKSLVAKLLVERGAGLLDADRAGHAVLAEDASVQRAIRERWGDEVFNEDGAVDRKAVARRVFAAGGAAEFDRRFLEDLLHPHIRRRLKSELAQFAAERREVVVLDAALLFEAGWQTLCDFVVFVDAPRETRLSRALDRGWSAAEFDRRETAQWPVDDKRRAADFILSNHGSEADLRQAVAKFWDRHIAPKPASGR
jgi:dephospho-CoA kinase